MNSALLEEVIDDMVTLFSRIGSYRAVMVLCCLFMAAPAAWNASTMQSDKKFSAGMAQRHERQEGPFTVNDREFTVILKLLTLKGASRGFDETVESFSVVDSDGKAHYQKSFNVEYNDYGFAESNDVSAYALIGVGRKGFLLESGKLKEAPPKERNRGLVLYYSYLPSAPLGGISCQAFVLKEEQLIPISLPLTVYGQIYELPPGSSSKSLRLFERDTMKFGVWTGWFEVIVPLQLLDNLEPVPLHFHSTYGYGAFEVSVRRRQPEELTFIRLFDRPEDSSISRHIVIQKDTKVEFILAYTKIHIRSGTSESEITVDEMPWLKVRIDGQEGFIKDAEDLMALGIYEAG
jgi:hypothetical protein